MVKEKWRGLILKLVLALWYAFSFTLVYVNINGVSTSAATTIKNGWVRENGTIYWYDNGVKAQSKEVYDSTGKEWYYIEADGTIARDKDVYIPADTAQTKGHWHRYDANGKLVIGESEKENEWYMFDPNGNMVKGFYQLSDGTNDDIWVYYDLATGKMVKGDQWISGNWYYFDPDTGEMYRGFSYHDGVMYNYNDDGKRKNLTWPVPGYGRETIDKDGKFGYRYHPVTGQSNDFHKGVDISAPKDTKVVSVAVGTVEETGCDNSRGIYMIIDHGNGVKTYYYHSSRLLVKKGDNVTAGQIIMLVGQSGQATGPHCHLGMSIDGKWVDPLKYI